MCTLTVVKHKDAMVFTFNRDEDKTRETIPPQLYSLEKNNIEYISPKDSVAGGTWIAMSDTGIVAFLLNGGKEKHKRKLPYKYSRGRIILDLLKSENPVSFLYNSNFDGVEPFTLITYIKEVLRELTWNGSVVEINEITLNEAKMWSSSTLYSADVKKERNDLLITQSNKTFESKESIKNWHQKAKSDGGLLYEGIPQVATVSTSQLLVNDAEGTFDYDDLLSGSQTNLTIQWQKA